MRSFVFQLGIMAAFAAAIDPKVFRATAINDGTFDLVRSGNATVSSRGEDEERAKISLPNINYDEGITKLLMVGMFRRLRSDEEVRRFLKIPSTGDHVAHINWDAYRIYKRLSEVPLVKLLDQAYSPMEVKKWFINMILTGVTYEQFGEAIHVYPNHQYFKDNPNYLPYVMYRDCLRFLRGKRSAPSTYQDFVVVNGKTFTLEMMNSKFDEWTQASLTIDNAKIALGLDGLDEGALLHHRNFLALVMYAEHIHASMKQPTEHHAASTSAT